MEKRTLIREQTEITVDCCRLTTCDRAAPSKGTMRDCSCDGSCIELNHRIQQGSIVMIRATGRGANFPLELPEGFRTLFLAEVKWSRQLNDGNVAAYAMGVRYLSN